MNLINLVISIFTFSSLITISSGKTCGRIMVRKEIREMTIQERTAFFNALKKLHSIKPVQGKNLTKLDYFGWAHDKIYSEVHTKPSFLPWHRYYLQLYQLMIAQIDPSVVIPYWDWTKESQEPHKSPILSGEYFGGNGNKDKGYEVENGFMANWELHYPNTHKLKRSFRKTINGKLELSDEIDPWPSSELMNSIINQNKVYSEFAWNAELYHGYVHVGLGGAEAEMGKNWSPNDLIFFLHHAYVDRFWWIWQKRNPDLAKTYDGKHFENNLKVSVNDMLNVPGAPSIPVKSTLDTLEWPFCYTYTDSDGTKIMLNSDEKSKEIVKDTNITKTNIDFDKIDSIMRIAFQIQDNPEDAKASEQLKESLALQNSKIKSLNPTAALEMMMGANPQRVIDNVLDANKKIEAISSLKGFRENFVKH